MARLRAALGGDAALTCRADVGEFRDPLFTQSNFGIATKMGVWLQRTSEAYQTLLLGVAKHDDLDVAIDTLRELMLDGTAVRVGLWEDREVLDCKTAKIKRIWDAFDHRARPSAEARQPKTKPRSIHDPATCLTDISRS